MSSETITRNDLTNILNEVLPPANVDYVIAQGTSGDWTYRKWNSGKCELWFKGTKTVTVNSTAGNIYVSSSNTDLEFPFTLQTVEYSVVSVFSSSYGIWAWQVNESTTKVVCRLFSNASRSSASYNFRAYVVGTVS